MIPALANAYFPSALDVRILPRWETEGTKPKFKLLSPFGFLSPTYGLIEAPEGELTNLASSPRFTKIFVDDDDPDIAFAAVIHDYLYRSGGQVGALSLTRKQCDFVIMEGMKLVGAPRWKYMAVYYSLRVGGASNFGEPTKAP